MEEDDEDDFILDLMDDGDKIEKGSKDMEVSEKCKKLGKYVRFYYNELKKNIFDIKEFNFIIFFECKVNFLKMNFRE